MDDWKGLNSCRRNLLIQIPSVCIKWVIICTGMGTTRFFFSKSVGKCLYIALVFYWDLLPPIFSQRQDSLTSVAFRNDLQMKFGMELPVSRRGMGLALAQLGQWHSNRWVVEGELTHGRMRVLVPLSSCQTVVWREWTYTHTDTILIFFCYWFLFAFTHICLSVHSITCGFVSLVYVQPYIVYCIYVGIRWLYFLSNSPQLVTMICVIIINYCRNYAHSHPGYHRLNNIFIFIMVVYSYRQWL